MFERLLRRPADQPPHAAGASNVQSKPGRPHVVGERITKDIESKKAGLVQSTGVFFGSWPI